MNIYELFPLKKSGNKFVVAVCVPHDITTLSTIVAAIERQIITKAFLVGSEEIVTKITNAHNLVLSNCEFVETDCMEEAAAAVAELIVSKKADVSMKGLIDTSIFLKAMLNNNNNNKNNYLSHIALVHREEDDQFYIISDGGMNIAPNLEQKKHILENAVEFANALNIQNPVVAVLAAKEKVYEKIPDTVDAENLRKMNEEGEIRNCRVFGPTQLDLAISKESAEIKGCKNPLAGEAKVLIVPDVNSGNICVKSLMYLGGFECYGIIGGASKPMIVVSRSSSIKEKLGTLYIARLMQERDNNV